MYNCKYFFEHNKIGFFVVVVVVVVVAVVVVTFCLTYHFRFTQLPTNGRESAVGVGQRHCLDTRLCKYVRVRLCLCRVCIHVFVSEIHLEPAPSTVTGSLFTVGRGRNAYFRR